MGCGKQKSSSEKIGPKTPQGVCGYLTTRRYNKPVRDSLRVEMVIHTSCILVVADTSIHLIGLPSLLAVQAGLFFLHLRTQQRLVPPVEVERFQSLATRLSLLCCFVFCCCRQRVIWRGTTEKRSGQRKILRLAWKTRRMKCFHRQAQAPRTIYCCTCCTQDTNEGVTNTYVCFPGSFTLS